MIFIETISKGPNSVKNVDRVTVLFLCTSSEDGLYLYKRFMQIYSQRYLSYWADMIFIEKISKGHNFVKEVGGVMVLFLCTLCDGGLYYYKVS